MFDNANVTAHELENRATRDYGRPGSAVLPHAPIAIIFTRHHDSINSSVNLRPADLPGDEVLVMRWSITQHRSRQMVCEQAAVLSRPSLRPAPA